MGAELRRVVDKLVSEEATGCFSRDPYEEHNTYVNSGSYTRTKESSWYSRPRCSTRLAASRYGTTGTRMYDDLRALEGAPPVDTDLAELPIDDAPWPNVPVRQ